MNGVYSQERRCQEHSAEAINYRFRPAHWVHLHYPTFARRAKQDSTKPGVVRVTPRPGKGRWPLCGIAPLVRSGLGEIAGA